MPTFDNLDSLFDHIQRKIGDSLITSVADAVRKQEKKAVQSVVYDVYRPTEYSRRGEAGGLISESNMRAHLISDSELEIENVTPPNDRYFNEALGDATVAEVVELPGMSDHWDFYDPSSGKGRPFTKATIQALKQNKNHVKALRKGLKREGIDAV